MSRRNGFTLVELMVVVAVALLLAAVGVPMYNGMVADNQMRSVHNNFSAHIQRARAEAMKRGGSVLLCPTAGCGEAWSVPSWVMFEDADSDGVQDGGEPNILSFTDPRAGTGNAHTLVNSSDADYIIGFNYRGLLTQGPAETTFTLSNGDSSKSLTLTASGKVKI